MRPVLWKKRLGLEFGLVADFTWKLNLNLFCRDLALNIYHTVL